VGKTMFETIPQITINRWCKQFPNGWFMALFYQRYQHYFRKYLQHQAAVSTFSRAHQWHGVRWEFVVLGSAESR
jgi:hypothetical protein